MSEPSSRVPSHLDYASLGHGFAAPNDGRAKAAVVLLLLTVALMLLNLPLMFWQWSVTDITAMSAFSGPTITVTSTTAPTTAPAPMPAPPPPPPPNPFAGQTRMQLIVSLVQGLYGLLMTGVWIAMIVLYQMWQYRAMQNVNLLGEPTRTSPGMGVGWWFIPVANLVMVGLVLRQLWNGARAVAERPMGSNPVPAIWVLWVLAWVLSLAGMVLGFYAALAGRQGLYNLGMLMGGVNTFLQIAFSVLLVVFIRKVQSTPVGGTV